MVAPRSDSRELTLATTPFLSGHESTTLKPSAAELILFIVFVITKMPFRPNKSNLTGNNG